MSIMAEFRSDRRTHMDDKPGKTTETNEPRWDWGARLLLALMVFWVFLAVGSTLYRFNLPTDGWLSQQSDELGDYGFIYETNVMGAPSALKPGDRLVAVGAISLAGNGLTTAWPLQREWRVGNVVRYTVMRNGREVQLNVRLMRWNLGAYWRSSNSAAYLAWILGSVAFLSISLLAFWRRPDNPAANALWVLAATVFAIQIVQTSLLNMIPDKVFPMATLSMRLFVTATYTILLPPTLIRFALVFPRPMPALRRRPWLAAIPYGIGLLGLGAFLAQLFAFGFVWMPTSIFISLGLLIYSAVTVRDAVGRAQMRWGLGGMLAGLGLFSLIFIPLITNISDFMENLLITIGSFSFGVMGLALGIAVLRYRLFDIDVIIRKTTSYAILTALLALVYFGSVVALERLLAPFTGESTAAVVLSTLLIAALFLPLRRRVQASIDRRFFRKKYDAEQVLARFAATARDETDLDALTAELLRVIQETMEPESVGLWLRPAEQPRNTN